MFVSLFSPSLPGTIPTLEILPFSASFSPFLSRISPLFADNVETLTLSVLLNSGKIILEAQLILYSLFSFTNFAVFVKFIVPADVDMLSSYFILYVFPSFVVSDGVIFISYASIPLYIFLFLFAKSSCDICVFEFSEIILYISSYFCSFNNDMYSLNASSGFGAFLFIIINTPPAIIAIATIITIATIIIFLFFIKYISSLELVKRDALF